MSLTFQQRVTKALSSEDGFKAMLGLVSVLEAFDLPHRTVRVIVVAPPAEPRKRTVPAGEFMGGMVELFVEEEG